MELYNTYRKFAFQEVQTHAYPLLGLLANKVYQLMESDSKDKMDRNESLNLSSCYYMSWLLPRWKDLGFYRIKPEMALKQSVPPNQNNSCYCDSIFVAIHISIGVPQWLLTKTTTGDDKSPKGVNNPEMVVVGANVESKLYPDEMIIKNRNKTKLWMKTYFEIPTGNELDAQKVIREHLYHVLRIIKEGAQFGYDIVKLIQKLRELVVIAPKNDSSTGSQESASYFFSKCTFDAGLGSIFSPILCTEYKTEYDTELIPPYVESNVCSDWVDVKVSLTASSTELIPTSVKVFEVMTAIRELFNTRSPSIWTETTVEMYINHSKRYLKENIRFKTKTHTKLTILRPSPVMAVEITYLTPTRDNRSVTLGKKQIQIPLFDGRTVTYTLTSITMRKGNHYTLVYWDEADNCYRYDDRETTKNVQLKTKEEIQSAINGGDGCLYMFVHTG
jgi:hypothetical protein